MESITWNPAAECRSCDITFLAKSFLAIQLSVDQLINGPYPNVTLAGNTMTCPNCRNPANVINYNPEQVKNEMLSIRESFLDVKEAELTEALKIISDLNPRNYDELYNGLKESCPSIAEIVQGFKGILNWFCLLGGSWAFFKEVERLLK